MSETDATAAGIAPKNALTKTAIVTKLLSRPKGATIDEVSAETGWQAHSIRAFFTGLRKKGNNLAREDRRDGARAYRLVKAPANADA